MQVFKNFLIILFFPISVYAQFDHADLKSLEKKLLIGDKSALPEIATYFDSTRTVQEFLGYHSLNTEIGRIARRIVDENCSFTEGELENIDSVKAEQFIQFIRLNYDRITFHEPTAYFLITPPELRKITYQVQQLSDYRKSIPKKPHSCYDFKLDSLIRKQNPEALLIVASRFVQSRNRFNRYHFEMDDCVRLLQDLTGSIVGVENEKRQISWHLEKEFYAVPRMNLYIFFAQNYQNYRWEKQKKHFVNPDLKMILPGKEELLFEKLRDENNAAAKRAFTELTICDPEIVARLADQYDVTNVDHNYSLPTFPYSFLKQLTKLTEYCRNSAISLSGNGELKKKMIQLQRELTFSERRELENKIITLLTPENVTFFEYKALIDEDVWGLTYSAGRILDIFYSQNWNTIVNNEKYLKAYLKKSALFNEIGIIGICNKYLVKFRNTIPSEQLKNLKTDDQQIESQRQKALKICSEPAKLSTETISWQGNDNYSAPDLASKIAFYTSENLNAEDSISGLLSKISYSQIGEALNAIEKIPFRTNWKKYSFMSRDFGFFEIDFSDKSSRSEFLKIYSRSTEFEVYSWYLLKSGVDYCHKNGSLNYDKIYELIKYDVVTAFVGGGGGMQDNEVYSLIKLLELTFGTTNGFPSKLCNSNNMYACYSQQRAKVWMRYLEENKLLNEKHDEPVSFND